MILFFPVFAQAEDVPPYYDLKTESITVFPSNISVGQACKITVTVKNNGTLNLSTSLGTGSFKYNFSNFSISKVNYTTPTYNQYIPKSGGVLIYEFEGKFTTSGEQNLYFSVNDNRELLEEKVDEHGLGTELYADNALSKSFIVNNEGENDIEIQPIIISNNKPWMDSSIDLKIKLKNIGKSSLAGSYIFNDSNYTLKADDFVIKTKTTSELPDASNLFDPGEVFEIVYTGTFPSKGAKNIEFEFNKEKSLEEKNFNNNATSTNVYVYLNENEAYDFSIINFEVQNISSSSVKVIWETNIDTKGSLLYRRNDSYDNQIIESSSPKKVHSVTVDKLFQGFTYIFQVKSKNGIVEKNTETITVKLKKDIPVILNGPNILVDSGNLTVAWKTDILSNSTLFFKKKGVVEYSDQKILNEYVLNHKIEKSLEEGEYEFYIESISMVNGKVKSTTGKFQIGKGEIKNESSSIEAKKAENTTSALEAINNISIKNTSMYAKLKGKIVLKVESNGEAYYINPKSETMHYLGRPEDAFGVMREQGVGISTKDLEKIEIGFASLSGTDTDGDGLSDMLEDAIGTDKYKKDTDGDGFEDKAEIEGGYNPKGSGKLGLNYDFAKNHYGKIFLQVEGKGEAWYISPTNGKRYFLGRPGDAFNVMRNLGLGISNVNFNSL